MSNDPASLARAAIHRLNDRDYDGWRQLLAPDFQMVYVAAIHGKVLNLSFTADEVLAAQAQLDESFPDMKRSILHTLQTATEAVVFLQVSGTHMGPYEGAPPTHRHIHEVLATRCEVEQARIQRCYVYRSPHHLRGELGLWRDDLNT